MHPRLQYTQQQKQQALDLLRELGKAEAARRTGIPAGTISSWAVRKGVTTNHPAPEQLAAAAMSLAQRKAALADDMLNRARSMIAQLDSTMVEKKALVVSDGRNEGSHIEVAEVEYDHPPTGAQKQIVETVAILIAQVQLLTGQATARLESTVTNQAEVAEARKRAIDVLDELAAKRAS